MCHPPQHPAVTRHLKRGNVPSVPFGRAGDGGGVATAGKAKSKPETSRLSSGSRFPASGIKLEGFLPALFRIVRRFHLLIRGPGEFKQNENGFSSADHCAGGNVSIAF